MYFRQLRNHYGSKFLNTSFSVEDLDGLFIHGALRWREESVTSAIRNVLLDWTILPRCSLTPQVNHSGNKR